MVLIPLILCVAYFTYWERKILGWIHARIGPNRVGRKGLLQPFADVIKMLVKEIVVPTSSNKFLFLRRAAAALIPALATWAVDAAVAAASPVAEHRRGLALHPRVHVSTVCTA